MNTWIPVNTIAAVCALAALVLPCRVHAQTIESLVLTDKIHKGSGVIDLLKDISGSDLSSYFTQEGNLLLLGVDLNEDLAGNEIQDSIGIAIKNAQLSITTTAGSFSFTDFFTSTTAMLKETGSDVALERYTLFGDVGSSQITGTGSLDISKFDDVMWFENINYTGDILDAKLTVNFLDTGRNNRTSSGAETFFDWSDGFEDFAIFSAADAVLLEQASIGVAEAPSSVTYTTEGTVVQAIATAESTGGANTSGATTGSSGDSIPNTPAAPAPPFVIAALMGLLLIYKQRNLRAHDDA